MELLLPRSFVLCLMLCSLGQSITPTHGLTPETDASNRTVLPFSVLQDEVKRYAKYAENPQVKDSQELRQKDRKVSEKKDCTLINTTDSPYGLQELQKVREKDLTFYVRPEPSFKRLVFRIRLQSIIDMLEEFYTEEAIDVHSSDLRHSESEPWTLINVKHYQHVSRGPDSHALRVTVANRTLSLLTHYWWLYHYEGFVIYVEGGAEVLLNCSPRDLQETLPTSVSKGLWLMGGLVVTASVLLALLFGVWLSMWCRQNRERRTPPPPLPPYPIYDEFDEEVLDKIRQKVDALRSCKSQDDLNNPVIGYYDARRENPYVVDMRLLKGGADLPKTIGDDKAPVEENSYQNVYSMRPTPTPRKTKETAEAQLLYQNLLYVSNSHKEMVDRDSIEKNLANSTDTTEA